MTLCVTTSNLVVLRQRVYAKNRREPPKLGSALVPPPCGWGVADPLEIRSFSRVISLNLVLLNETCVA